MSNIRCTYTGHKHCDLVHTPTNTQISTDAPKDNNGKGETFSPTDLVAGALISCMLTVMAINSEKDNISLFGAYGVVIKEMSPEPRKIAALPVELHLPKNITPEWRTRLEKIALECPVKRSLNPDIEVRIQFLYDV